MSILTNEAMKSADVADVAPKLKKPTSAVKKAFVSTLFIIMPMLLMFKKKIPILMLFPPWIKEERKKRFIKGGNISGLQLRQPRQIGKKAFIQAEKCCRC